MTAEVCKETSDSTKNLCQNCVKSVQIRSFSGPLFPVFGRSKSPYISGKYGPEKTPYLDTFHTVQVLCMSSFVTIAIIPYFEKP